MKTIAGLFLVAGLLFSPTFIKAQTSKNSLIGTWRMLSSVGHVGDGGWDNDSSKIYQVKTITPTRFMFTIYDKRTDSLRMSAQGSIVIKGNMYSEKIDQSTSKGMIGPTFTYTSTLKGNRWHIEGGSTEMKIVEDWIRID